MALICLASISGAPGVTTFAVASTVSGPRPALLVEADTSRQSSVLAGYLQGQFEHTVGLTHLAVTSQRGRIEQETLWSQMVPLSAPKHQRYLIPGFRNISAGTGTSKAFWSTLGAALTTVELTGADVYVDLGRLAPRDPRIGLLQLADATLLLCNPSLPDVSAAKAITGDNGSHIDEIKVSLDEKGKADSLGLLLVEKAYENYTNKEVSDVLRVPVIARLPYSSRTAAVYANGMTRTPKFHKADLNKAVSAALSSIHDGVKKRRAALEMNFHGLGAS